MAKRRKARKAAARGSDSGIPPSRRICNLVPSEGTERDWGFAAALAAGLASRAPLPNAVDLRASWWTIGDQEDTGSCVGWATAEGVVRYHMVQAGKLKRSQPLSPRHVWMSSKEIDEFTNRPTSFVEGAGTSLKAAVDVCRDYGTVLESLLPFHIATKLYSGDEDVFYAEAAQRRIASYFNLRRVLDDWKSWLATKGPILVGVSVDRTWDNAAATGGNLDTFLPATVRGGHAVSVVGYTASGRFILRNSWGTGWGDQGFAYASPGYIAAAFFDESYGVTI